MVRGKGTEMTSSQIFTGLQSHLFLLVFAGLNLAAVPYSNGEPFEEAIEEKITPPITADLSKSKTPGLQWEAVYRAPHSTYMRLHFSEIKAPKNADYKVRMMRMDGTVLLTYLPEQFTRFSNFLSEPLFVEEVRIQVTAPKAHTSMSFRIDRVAHDTKSGQVASKSSGVGRSKPISTLSEDFHVPPDLLGSVKKVEEAVAKLFIGTTPTCTGFLADSDVVLTNYHCLGLSGAFRNAADDKRKSPEACRDIAVIFDYYDGEHNPKATSPCLTVIDFNEKLDYAALKVDKERIKVRSQGGDRQRNHLTLSATQWNDKEPKDVFVIHHPNGKPKEVSYGCKAWFKKKSNTLDHDCNTHRGSSGSPLIFSDGSAAVGLHYSGSYDPSMTAEEADLRGDLNKYNLAKPSYLIKQSYVASKK